MKVLCVLVLALAAFASAEEGKEVKYLATPYAAFPYPYSYNPYAYSFPAVAAAPAVVPAPAIYSAYNFPAAANYRFQLDTTKAPSEYVRYPYGFGPFANNYGVVKKAE